VEGNPSLFSYERKPIYKIFFKRDVKRRKLCADVSSHFARVRLSPGQLIHSQKYKTSFPFQQKTVKIYVSRVSNMSTQLCPFSHSSTPSFFFLVHSSPLPTSCKPRNFLWGDDRPIEYFCAWEQLLVLYQREPLPLPLSNLISERERGNEVWQKYKYWG